MRGQHVSTTQDPQGNSDVPFAGAGERARPPADVAERLQGPAFVLDNCRKRDTPRAAFVADKEVVKGHA